MQDMSQFIRSLFLAGLVSLGAPLAGCTVVDDDEPDAEFQADDDDIDLDDDDVDVEIDD